MKTPLPLTLILTEQTIESTGWMLQWSADALPVMWEGKVTPSGAIEIPRPLARLISETLFGTLWEAHKAPKVGQLSAGWALMSTHAAAPSGRSE